MAAPLRSRPESGREGIRRTTRHALRQSVPLSSIRTVTVGFEFSPNLLPLPTPAGARGLRRSLAITAGGDFHPALRTSAGQPPSHRYYGHSGTFRATVLTRDSIGGGCAQAPGCDINRMRAGRPRSNGKGSMMETRAAVAHKAGQPLSIETVRLDGPKAGEVLVEIKATGICHTDAYTLSGADPEGLFPAILGHEGAGIVVDVGKDVASLTKGDHVIPLYVPECRTCDYCTSGRTNLCQE